MNFPTLPTDNLYKFCTIFGLVISAFCGYFYISNTQHTLDMLRIAQVNQARSGAEQSNIQINLKVLEGNPDKLDATQLAAERNRLRAKLQDSRVAVAQQGAELQTTTEYVTRYELIEPFLLGFGGLGGVIFLGGLVAWFARHQSFQDKLLRAELEKAIAALEPARQERFPFSRDAQRLSIPRPRRGSD